MWHLVDLVRNDDSEERITSIFRVEKIREPEKCQTFPNTLLANPAFRWLQCDGIKLFLLLAYIQFTARINTNYTVAGQ
jgi:hypothetical protein